MGSRLMIECPFYHQSIQAVDVIGLVQNPIQELTGTGDSFALLGGLNISLRSQKRCGPGDLIGLEISATRQASTHQPAIWFY